MDVRCKDSQKFIYQNYSQQKVQMKVGQCLSCLFGLIGIAGCLWWLWYGLFISDFCGTYISDYMDMSYSTWKGVNTGMVILGPLVAGIYSCCTFAGDRQPTRQGDYLYYASSDTLSDYDRYRRAKVDNCLTCWILVHTVFEVSWIIIGSVLFFGYYINHWGSGCNTSIATNIVYLSFNYLLLAFQMFLFVSICRDMCKASQKK